MKILVIGANGNFGRAAVTQLVKRGAEVRGLASNETSAKSVAANGAEAVVGDFRDVDSLRAAMRGVDKVYHTHPSLLIDEHRIARNSIQAAKAEGVGHFVFLSVINPHLPDVPVHWNKLLATIDLMKSGLPYTVLQPSSAMQNVGWALESMKKDGVWPVPYAPETKISWVDREDVAEAAANVLLEPGHEYGHYELTATEPLTVYQVADLLSSHLGKPISLKRLPHSEFLAQPFWKGKYSPDHLQHIRMMFEHFDQYGMYSGNPKILSMILHREPTSWKTFLQRVTTAA